MRSELHERESRIAKLLKESEEQVDQLEQVPGVNCDAIMLSAIPHLREQGHSRL